MTIYSAAWSQRHGEERFCPHPYCRARSDAPLLAVPRPRNVDICTSEPFARTAPVEDQRRGHRVARMYKRIVVGTDGSPTARLALQKAIDLATTCGAELHIVSAYRPIPVRQLEATRGGLPEELRWSVSSDQEVLACLGAAQEAARVAGIEAETLARTGEPADAILGAAEDLAADMIVVGSRGIERRIMGSVPNSVTHRAQCDVLVVHTT